MPPLEINLSQSALGYHGCILEQKHVIIDGYYDIPSSNIVYGEAIHKYRHVMFQTNGHIPTARDAALKEFRKPKIGKKNQPHLEDERHMITSAHMYFELFVKEDKSLDLVELNGKPATEVSFSIPYYTDEHIKVNLCGTLDGIAKIKGGCYIVQDLKTTSAWDTRSYFGAYKMSRQLRFYVLALRLMAKQYPDSILGQIGATNVGARIDALFVKPAPNENKYGSSDVFQYTPDEIVDFQHTIDALIYKFSMSIKLQHFPKEGILNNSCTGKWGACMFTNVCVQSSPQVAELLLKRDFKTRVFNPLDYNNTKA